jgi:tRNA A37 N6-isopentenylltransferase MiaA
VIVTGGSGLYLEALLRGLMPPAVPPQPELRRQLEALGQPLCHALLSQADGAAAAGLRRALTSMSPEMVAYKRLDRVRQVVISWL